MSLCCVVLVKTSQNHKTLVLFPRSDFVQGTEITDEDLAGARCRPRPTGAFRVTVAGHVHPMDITSVLVSPSPKSYLGCCPLNRGAPRQFFVHFPFGQEGLELFASLPLCGEGHRNLMFLFFTSKTA